MNDFSKRNELRNRQIEYAKSRWVKQVGDRVQLTEDYGDHSAWESGVIVSIKRELWRAGMTGMELPTVTIEMASGGTLKDDNDRSPYGRGLPLVPHEDYFKDEPPTSEKVGLVE